MIDEDKIYAALSDLAEVFNGVDGELPSRLERIRTFVGATIAGFVRPIITADDICREIDKERDRRIDGGFTFRDTPFQSRPSDRENIMGAAQLAMAFMAAGGDPESLRWADPDKDFVWIAADNTIIPMSPMDVVALFQAGVAFKSALTFYARALKDAVIDAEDPTTVDVIGGWPE